MFEHFIVGIIFLIALGYLGWILKNTISLKEGCNKGCGCDFKSKIKIVNKNIK